ncbi:MAG: LLM class flavin-dependent oxidoreductase [Actinomycetota bacterium]
MRLGYVLPFTDLGGGPLRPSSWADAAVAAEVLGYRSVWTFDAIGRGFMLPDPLMALSAVASATNRLELGTGIMQLPIRNTIEVAHRVFTLEVLAPGRVLFGVGPGSTEADFVTYGGSYTDRFDTFEGQWADLRTLVATGRVGERDLHAWPGVLGGPALLLAGWHGRWVERAAAESAGWIASGMNADDAQLADGLARYRDAGGGRAVVTNIQVGEDTGPAVERINRLGEMGFDDVVVVDLNPTDDRLAAVSAGTIGDRDGAPKS